MRAFHMKVINFCDKENINRMLSLSQMSNIVSISKFCSLCFEWNWKMNGLVKVTVNLREK